MLVPCCARPSGVLYVASRNGRTVAKVVGSTLETVIASETLPVDMQFAACRVFASNFVHQSSWVVGTCCGWPNLNWGPVFPIRPVCNWRWNNLCCWLCTKERCWPSTQAAQVSQKSCSVQMDCTLSHCWFRTDRCIWVWWGGRELGECVNLCYLLNFSSSEEKSCW